MKNDKKITTITSSWPVSTIIFLAFFFAKIFDKIDWSWWWVFSPLWIPLALVGLILLIMGLIWVGAVIIDKYF